MEVMEIRKYQPLLAGSYVVNSDIGIDGGSGGDDPDWMTQAFSACRRSSSNNRKSESFYSKWGLHRLVWTPFYEP